MRSELSGRLVLCGLVSIHIAAVVLVDSVRPAFGGLGLNLIGLGKMLQRKLVVADGDLGIGRG